MNDLHSRASQLLQSIVDRALLGLPPLSSARELALTYQRDQRYPDPDACVTALIRRETTKTAVSSAVSNFGGLATLPISIPASLYLSFGYQARLSGAIACLYGHDLASRRVRTLVGLSLAGESAVRLLKSLGVHYTTRVLEQGAAQLSEKILTEIGASVGMQIMAKTGDQAAAILVKSIPVVSAVVCGAIDWAYCRGVGTVSRKLFRT